MDRRPVLMCSSIMGAQPTGVRRLTTQAPAEEGRKGRYSKHLMSAPQIADQYNATMGGVDVADFMALNLSTSWQRGVKSNAWWMVLFWGLMDKVQVNSYVLFKSRQTKRYSHAKYYRELTVQLFNLAANMGTTSVVNRRSSGEGALPATPSQLGSKTPSRTPTFRPSQGVAVKSPPKKLRMVEGMTDHVPGRFHYSGKDGKNRQKRSCWFCKKTGAGKEGAERRPGSIRFEFNKTQGGCITCNVPLCLRGACWTNYHAEFPGQNDSMPPEIWDKSWTA
jgi:hypothetical protein